MFALRQNLRQCINSKALKNIKAVNNTRYLASHILYNWMRTHLIQIVGTSGTFTKIQ